MSLLRRTIRLAATLPVENPLRQRLLAVLREARTYQEYVDDKKSRGESPQSKADWEKHQETGQKGQGPRKEQRREDKRQKENSKWEEKEHSAKAGKPLSDMSEKDSKAVEERAKAEAAWDYADSGDEHLTPKARANVSIHNTMTETGVNLTDAVKALKNHLPKGMHPHLDSALKRSTV